MSDIKIIELEEGDFLKNDEDASELREQLKDMGVFMLNVMGAPGAGKTELIHRTIPYFSRLFKVGCLCTDLDTTLDANRLSEVCDHVIQFQAAGMWPYVSAEGARLGLMEMMTEDVNVVILENLGVLISAAAWDTGSSMNVAVLSAADGADTPLKYPYMFAISDAVVINGMDLASTAGFDLKRCIDNLASINETTKVFPVSARTGEGMEEWVTWLMNKIRSHTGER